MVIATMGLDLTTRLARARKTKPYDRLMAVVQLGFGMSVQDIAATTGLTEDVVRALRMGNRGLIRAIGAAPDTVRAKVLEWQQEDAITKGFVLAHSRKLSPADLKNLALAAQTLSKIVPKPEKPPREPAQRPPKARAGVVASMAKPDQ